MFFQTTRASLLSRQPESETAKPENDRSDFRSTRFALNADVFLNQQEKTR
jgi:hypothetical protein